MKTEIWDKFNKNNMRNIVVPETQEENFYEISSIKDKIAEK